MADEEQDFVQAFVNEYLFNDNVNQEAAEALANYVRPDAAFVNFDNLRALYFGENDPPGVAVQEFFCSACEDRVYADDICEHSDGYVKYHPWCCTECTPEAVYEEEYVEAEDYDADPILREVDPVPERVTNPKPLVTPATFRNQANRVLGFSPTVNGDQPTDEVANLANRHVSNSNVITSLNAENGYHYPVLNIDFPVTVYPSTVPGHYHVYIDRPIEHDRYFELLDMMARAGLTNTRWVRSARQLGASWVRLPWVHHGDRVDPEAHLPFFEEEDELEAFDEGAQQLLNQVVELKQNVDDQQRLLQRQRAEIEEYRAEILRLNNTLAERRVALGWQ